MEEDSQHTEIEPTGQETRKLGQNPRLPLEQRGVQITVAVLGICAVAAILWMGRTTFRSDIIPNHSRSPGVTLLQIDINQADVREFALLPGVGPVLASRIVADRRQNGSFHSLEDLSRIHGIGQKTIDQIVIYCLPVDGPEVQVALAEE